MLILTRRVGETVMIGNDVTVTVLGVKGNQVRVGINAPKNVAVHREAAEAYLKYTYTDEAQEIFAKHFYRPSNETILKKHSDVFPANTKLFPITAIAKDWPDAHKQLVGDGGVFDSINKPKGR